MVYEKSERRSAFLLGYCARRLASFLRKLLEDSEDHFTSLREFEVYLGLIEENTFLLAESHERALVVEMNGLIASLKSACWDVHEVFRKGEAVPAFTRHRAAEFADKIETLAPLLARKADRIQAVHDFGGAIAKAVTMAESGVGDRNDGWDQALLLKDGLTEEEQGLAYMAFDLGLGNGDHLLDSIGGRIKLFGLGLSKLDEHEAAHRHRKVYASPSEQAAAPITAAKVYQVPRQNDERDAFIYEQYKKGATLKAIRIQINSISDWEDLTEDRSVHKALSDYTKSHGLPKLYKQTRKKRERGVE